MTPREIDSAVEQIERAIDRAAGLVIAFVGFAAFVTIGCVAVMLGKV